PSFYLNLTNPDAPPPGEVFPATLNGFFKKTSYGQLQWLADVGGVGGVGAPGGWLTLPGPHSDYCSASSTVCEGLSQLMNDAMTLGRANGIDFSNYDNINFVASNELDCCAYGGGFFSGVENKFFGVTIAGPPYQETQTYAHELGHSIGLPHSGWA